MSVKSTSSQSDGGLPWTLKQSYLPDEDALSTFLKDKVKDGFVSTATWRGKGDATVFEPDDTAGLKPHRFEPEITRKLMPWPEDKSSIPRKYDFSTVGLHLLKEGDKPTDGLNEAQLRALNNNAVSGPGGTGTSGAKPGFLTLDTTAQRMKGEFDPELLAALDGHRAEELDRMKDRDNMHRAPFEGEDPDRYRPTSYDYCDMGGIDPSAYRVTEHDPSKPWDDDAKLEVYKSRYNLVEREGPVRRENTHQAIQRGNRVDKPSLRGTLDSTTRSTLPRGYNPASASHWISTTHDHHTAYDVRAAAEANTHQATVPLPNRHRVLDDTHEMAVTKKADRFSTRHTGTWETEHSSSYKDRFGQAEINKDYSRQCIFDIDHGIYTMNHNFHHPRSAKTGESYSPSEVVPGQYASMSRRSLHARNRVSDAE